MNELSAGAPRGDHRTPAGPQHVIPGAERVGDGELAQRRANAPMRPSAQQKACGGPLQRRRPATRQLDLIDAIGKVAECHRVG